MTVHGEAAPGTANEQVSLLWKRSKRKPGTDLGPILEVCQKIIRRGIRATEIKRKIKEDSKKSRSRRSHREANGRSSGPQKKSWTWRKSTNPKDGKTLAFQQSLEAHRNTSFLHQETRPSKVSSIFGVRVPTEDTRAIALLGGETV